MIKSKEIYCYHQHDTEEYQNYLFFSYLRGFKEQSDIKYQLKKNNGLKRLKNIN